MCPNTVLATEDRQTKIHSPVLPSAAHVLNTQTLVLDGAPGTSQNTEISIRCGGPTSGSRPGTWNTTPLLE